MWGISPDEAEEPDATLGALGVGGLLGPVSIPGRVAALAADAQQPLSPSSNLRSMLGVNAPDGVASLGGSLAHLGFCEQRPDAAQSPSRLASWCNGDEPSSSGGASSAPQLPAAILGEPPAGLLPSAILPGMGAHAHAQAHAQAQQQQASAQQEQAQLHHLLQLQAAQQQAQLQAQQQALQAQQQQLQAQQQAQALQAQQQAALQAQQRQLQHAQQQQQAHPSAPTPAASRMPAGSLAGA